MEIIVNFGGRSNCDALNSGVEGRKKNKKTKDVERKKKKKHLSREASAAF